MKKCRHKKVKFLRYGGYDFAAHGVLRWWAECLDCGQFVSFPIKKTPSGESGLTIGKLEFGGSFISPERNLMTKKITPHKGGVDGRREKRFPSARMTKKDYDYFLYLNMSGGDFIHWAILAHKKQNEETKRKIEKFVI